MFEFNRIKRLPPYVFAIVNNLKMEARHRGVDIVDLGMGNPDLPTPQHIVDKLREATAKRDTQHNHRYSASRGITQLRVAMTEWYKRRYDVDLDPDREVVVTIGSKEGLSHLTLAAVQPGDVVMVPAPAYPIHPYAVIIAGGETTSVPVGPGIDFFFELEQAFKKTWPRPKMIILNFPHNPTAQVLDGLEFFEKVVDFAKEHKIMVIHDLAYADICFDGYKAPSFLQVPGAKDVGVEFFSLSKSYSMPGWRVGFCVGNPEIVGALTKIKSYLDYGMFQPIQIASIVALRGPQDCVADAVKIYQSRRNELVNGLTRIGWETEMPRATMFHWARIPEEFRHMGSLEFCKFVLKEGGVAISPGVGFGEGGDEYVRFAMVENEHRIRQAIKGIKKALTAGA